MLIQAIEKRITWLQAADIIGITARHTRRVRAIFEKHGWGGLRDGRVGNTRRKRIPGETIERLCELRREKYADFSLKHFHERATEQHGIELSYTWTKQVLQAAELAEKAPGRGKYRRKRERRPMIGMLLHPDASTPWCPRNHRPRSGSLPMVEVELPPSRDRQTTLPLLRTSSADFWINCPCSA